MGAGQSTDYSGASPEELSHLLAERFATKCFTPLELTHFKDNFFSRAAEQGGLRYWNEQILSDFLGIPDGSFSSAGESSLDAGPVLFRMVSYLAAFPFQNTLAPSVLTFEAMVKVVVLLTERYGKVLRRGRKDRIKLLFGSLADVGRKHVEQHSEKGRKEDHSSAENTDEEPCPAKSHAAGFSIDEPANDEYDEDEDDDLALAALESLDAIDVFKHDHRVDKTVYETGISLDTFRRLIMLLLAIAPLKPLEHVKKYTSDMSPGRIEEIRKEADTIIAAFRPDESGGGITYRAFARTILTSLPYLFDPLTALFEHLLFSEKLNLSQKRQSETEPEVSRDDNTEGTERTGESPLVSKPILLPGSFESTILTPSALAHLSFFLSSNAKPMNLYRSGIRLHPVFSTAAHGSSLTSFSHNVLTWQSANVLLLQGAVVGKGEETVTIGAFIPQSWKSSSSHGSSSSSDALPCLFQLSPKHQVLPGNPSSSVHQQKNLPTAWFSTHTGLAIGCKIPPASRSQHLSPKPHGAASLTVDVNLESAELFLEPVGHEGVFLPAGNSSMEDASVKLRIDIYTLEVWGVVPDPELAASAEPSTSAVEAQRAQWDFEAREAERRRNINLKTGAGDSAKESARWLLETAGVIGDHGQYSGGST